MPSWVIASVATVRQPVILSTLEMQGHKSKLYVPLSRYYTKPRHKNSPVLCSKYAFPGYIFLIMDEEVHALISELQGFKGFLFHKEDKTGSEYCVLSDDTIESIKQQEQQGVFDVMRKEDKARLVLAVGAKIQLEVGLWAGELATVERIQNKKNQIEVSVAGIKLTLPLVVDDKIVYSMPPRE